MLTAAVMNIIIFPCSRTRLICISHLRGLNIAGLALGAIILVLILLGSGYAMGILFGNQVILGEWKKDIQEHEARLQLARQDIQTQVDLLTAQAGLLQAQINRVDTLGSVLVEAAGFEPEEFSFDPPSAIGGPGFSMDNILHTDIQIGAIFEEIQTSLEVREHQLQALGIAFLNKKFEQDTRPHGRPVVHSWISSRFGKRRSPFTGKPEMHKGMDFGGRIGSDVVAVGGGIVTQANRNGGYGYIVEIDHGKGYRTRYAHNKKLLVSKGEVVKRGHVIAKLGDTGRSTGPHVHFEVLKDGVQVDPMKFLQ